MLHHDPAMVLLAACMCLVGSYVSVGLSVRTVMEHGWARLHWGLLTSIISGCTIWATHFIAMLGYHPPVPASLDGSLTLASAHIAIIGSAISIGLACLSNRWPASVASGAGFGLTIAAMHYTGMGGYVFEGEVTWDYPLIAMSVALGTILATAAILRTRITSPRRVSRVAVLFWVLAIVTLHFTGMAAFTVTPFADAGSVGQTSGRLGEVEVYVLTTAILTIGVIVLGVGIGTFLADRRTLANSRQKLNFQARHDPLTGLANRRSFSESLARHCRAMEQGKAPFALLLIDLDRFKPINDSLGHQIGDEVLKRIAGRLLKAARRSDLVARIGGDEFAIVASGVSHDSGVAEIAARVVDIVARPLVIDETMVELGASVGISLAPHHACETEALINHADFALYSAKRQGKSRWVLFDDQLREAIARRRELEADLRRAVVHDEFNVVYQPITDARSEAVMGAEALVRWTSPRHGDVAPSEFIPLAEELGLVARIGASVLRSACSDARHWPNDVKLSVNLSPVQILDPRTVPMVTQVLAETGIEPARVELEITETALLGDDELALRTLRGLVALGVRISLDDFGTGYSSLSYLHRFPIDRIKIDRSFIARLPLDPGSASIVRAIAQLGKNLDLAITAEGIETAEQLDFIAREGCDNAQGYLVGHPMNRIAFAQLFGTAKRVGAA